MIDKLEAPARSGKPRAPALYYLGFRTTQEGREYSLRVTDGLERRLFVLLIPHQAFASRDARFQDGPDLCFSRLHRELLEHPELQPGAPLVLTTPELLAYRAEKQPPVRQRPR